MRKLLSTLCLIIVVFSSFIFMSNTNNNASYNPITKEMISNLLYGSGSPGGYTGSLGDGGLTCTDCHDPGANFNLSPTITTNIPEQGYVLGATYSIQVSGTTNGTEAGRGFELTAEKSTGVKVGVFDITDATGSPQLIGTNAVTHNNEDFDSWSFNWTAPATNEGEITFYAAVIAVNGSGTKGDQTVTAAVSVNSNTLSISEENMLAFEIYPNPVQDFLTIQLPNEIMTGSIEVIDYLGRTIKSKEISKIDNKLNLTNLSSGVYLMRLNAEGKTGVRKIIKQ